MKIVNVRATAVTVPLYRPLRWSFGVETGTTRTVVELITDEGLVGLGETRGGDEVVRAVEEHRDLYIGVDPLEVWRIARRFGVFRLTSEQLALVGAAKLAGAGIEMACWDLIGKSLGKRCGDLWGGIAREHVEFSAYAFYRYDSVDAVGSANEPENAANHAIDLIETYGFRDVKFKAGVLEPEAEIETVRLMRENLGERLRYLRIDPNAVWAVDTSVRVLNRIADYGISFCEDPTWGLEGLARVRERTPVALATNMACVTFEQIAAAVRMKSLDVILSDIHFWGGITACLQLAKICETFNLGLGVHSDRELGVSTAAVLHFAGSEDMINHSVDTHVLEQADDIITAPFTFRDGSLKVPTEPGLGVELDREKLEKYAEYHRQVGEASEFRDTVASTNGRLPKY